MSDQGSTKLGLRDLVVGEPAMEDALDADAARRQAATFVNEAAADVRIAAAVEKVGGKVAPHEASTLRLPGAPTAEITVGAASTLPPTRATAPHLPAVSVDTSGESDAGRTTAEPGVDGAGPRRLTRLAMVTLGVAVLLLALVMLGRSPSTGGDAGAPAGTVAEPAPLQTTGAALATGAPTAGPTSAPAPTGIEAAGPPDASVRAPSTATAAPTTAPSPRRPTERATPAGPERPGASAKAPPPDVPPAPTTDRPF